MTEKMMVDCLLDLSPQFLKAYNIINDLKYDITTYDDQQFIEDLQDSKRHSLRQYVRTCLNTLMYYSEGIRLALQCKYTNCPIEGINYRIKHIKRSGYGYRNVYHLKARILHVNGLFEKTKTDRREISLLPVHYCA